MRAHRPCCSAARSAGVPVPKSACVLPEPLSPCATIAALKPDSVHSSASWPSASYSASCGRSSSAQSSTAPGDMR
eukprot:2034655-Prymnesium_polylepis.1